MVKPKVGDVLIRDAGPSEFVIADAITREALCGHLESIADAVTAARQLSPHGVIWRETTDERGRSLGDPFALPWNEPESLPRQ